MHSPRSFAAPVGDPAPVRIGRLRPLPGVALRTHPDRGQVLQLLGGLQPPLAEIRSMLDLARQVELPDAVRVALLAAHEQSDYLIALVGEFAELGQLELDRVAAAPQRMELLPWWQACVVEQRECAAALGIALEPRFRSFLPSLVRLDGTLAARAFAAVLRAALLRALPGDVALRIAWDDGGVAGHAGRLAIEVATRGGGFDDVELGYVFTPFAVRDAASRPLLGLAIAHRLCVLLGGALTVHSAGAMACTYRLEIAAEAADGATWLDPLAAAGDFGPVRGHARSGARNTREGACAPRDEARQPSGHSDCRNATRAS